MSAQIFWHQRKGAWTHFNVDQALAAAERIGAHQTFFTHIAHEISHADLESRLPKYIRLGFDGLTLEILC